MDKYYTPTIEEFHVGFEFEIKSETQHNTWHKRTVRPTSRTAYIKKALTRIRVKYLDREGIESFDFGYDSKYKEHVEKNHGTAIYHHPTIEHRGEKKQLMLIHNVRSNWVLLSLSNGNPAYAAEKRFGEDGIVVEVTPINTIFAGKIKNKSEFKKLLTQIGI